MQKIFFLKEKHLYSVVQKTHLFLLEEKNILLKLKQLSCTMQKKLTRLFL